MEPLAVLAVDDEPLVLELIRRLLPGPRYAVVTAEDGSAGIGLAAQQAFDVAIVDLHMPGCDGLDVVGAIKKGRPECVTIVLTGHATVEAAQALIREGCDDLLLKPLDDPDLLDRTIQRGLERRRLIEGIESLAHIGDTQEALLRLVRNAVVELSRQVGALERVVREHALGRGLPEIDSLCDGLRTGLASLGTLVDPDGGS